eukprot:10665109-Alexandrium_andersonii.AAC.1
MVAQDLNKAQRCSTNGARGQEGMGPVQVVTAHEVEEANASLQACWGTTWGQEHVGASLPSVIGPT